MLLDTALQEMGNLYLLVTIAIVLIVALKQSLHIIDYTTGRTA